MSLPINLKPTLSTYLYLAYPFAILETPKIPTTMLCLNIQLRFQRKYFGPYVHHLTIYPSLGLQHYMRLGLFHATVHPISSQTPFLQDALTGLVISSLNSGHYLYSFVDYYHLPGTAQYDLCHFRHDLLIYGYDHSTACFKGAVFTKERKFGSIDIPYDKLAVALASPHARGEDCAAYCRGDALVGLLPIRNNDKYQGVDLTAICQQLTCFVCSISSFKLPSIKTTKPMLISEDSDAHNSSTSYGRSVYAEIINYFEEFTRSGSFDFDIRITRLLYEHKVLMRKRLQAMVKAGYKKAVKALNGWSHVEFKAKEIHLKAVLSMMRKDRDVINDFKRNFVQLDLLENNILEKLI